MEGKGDEEVAVTMAVEASLAYRRAHVPPLEAKRRQSTSLLALRQGTEPILAHGSILIAYVPSIT